MHEHIFDQNYGPISFAVPFSGTLIRMNYDGISKMPMKLFLRRRFSPFFCFFYFL